MERALATALGAMLLVSCAGPGASRWDAPSPAELEALAEVSASVPTDGAIGSFGVATLDVGPVVDGRTTRVTLQGADLDLVVAGARGRVEQRVPSPGDAIEQGDVIVRLGAEADEAQRIRLQILDLEGRLAELDGDTAAMERIDAEAAMLRRSISAGDADVVSDVGGVFSHHVVASFVSIEAGDVVAAVATSERAVAVVPLGDDAENVSIGDPVSLRARFDPNSPAVVGTVVSIGDGVARVDVPADAGLSIGVRVEVAFTLPTADVLRAPAEAVRRSDRGDFVVIVADDGSLEGVDVEVGASGGGLVEIRDPLGRLAAGTRVVLP